MRKDQQGLFAPSEPKNSGSQTEDKKKITSKPKKSGIVQLEYQTPKEDLAGFAKEKVYQVAEYIGVLNNILQKQAAKVAGEISELKQAVSGHVYFKIKDKSGEAVLDCIIWKGNYELCGIALAVGMEVMLAGAPKIYPQRGTLSFVADTVELVGEGALKKAYDALKNKLELEGAFDPARKKPMPELPVNIGVITSRDGAVIHDFLNNVGRYGFSITLVDTRVEGQQAIKDLMLAVKTFKSEPIDALVIIRGGGSLESLQAFNNEALVREILDFPVPVIAGIGHDKDVPLLALAADAMVSTPTAAAHLLTESWDTARANLNQAESVIMGQFPLAIRNATSELENMRGMILNLYANARQTVGQKLESLAKLIRSNDPERQLRIGYAIASLNGKVVKSAADVKVGDSVSIKLHKGEFGAEVKKIDS